MGKPLDVLVETATHVSSVICSWIESDRDESEDIGRIERGFDDATDGVRGALRDG